MMDINCIFCKIIKGEIGHLEYEDDLIVAFKSLEPKAKVHLLIVPKKHIENLYFVNNDDQGLLGHLLLVSRMLADKFNIKFGFRLVANNGPDAEQEIYHLHFHFLAGERLTDGL